MSVDVDKDMRRNGFARSRVVLIVDKAIQMAGFKLASFATPEAVLGNRYTIFERLLTSVVNSEDGMTTTKLSVRYWYNTINSPEVQLNVSS
jgi:hypothetical protein